MSTEMAYPTVRVGIVGKRLWQVATRVVVGVNSFGTSEATSQRQIYSADPLRYSWDRLLVVLLPER